MFLVFHGLASINVDGDFIDLPYLLLLDSEPPSTTLGCGFRFLRLPCEAVDMEMVYFQVILTMCVLPLAIVADPEATVVYLNCENAKYANGSAIQRSIDAVLNSTVESVPKSGGFNTSSHGDNPDKVYGLAQCRGDLTPSDCQACTSFAKRYVLQHCDNISASINLDGCFLRYDTYNFFSKWEKNHTLILCNTQNSTDPSRFNGTIARVLSNVTAKAVSGKGFGVGSTTEFVPLTIYSMAQCWRDLRTKECRECLAFADRNIFRCDPGSLGAQIVSRNCYLRYEIYKFFNTSVLSSPPSALAPAAVRPPSTEGSGHKSKLAIILGTVGAALVVLLGLGLLLWRRKQLVTAKQQDEGRENCSVVVPAAISNSKLNFKYETLKTATKNFDPANKLGEGAFGSVYKGIVEGREIAVKRLFLNTRKGVDEFFNEVNLISRVKHKNLVRLLGCSADGPERLLVYEYLPNTSLDKFIFDANRNKDLDWRRRFDIATGTAGGLAYLHEESEIRIIHRDIKASNILLDENMKPKISDFGLARFFADDKSHLSTGIAGTLGYMAPEYVLHGQLTEKVDVFSFGVLVLEIVTGRKNSSSSNLPDGELPLLEAVWKHYEAKTLIPEIIKAEQVQGKNEEEEALRVVQVALLCTQASPALRPAMWEVVVMLTTDYPTLPEPTQPAMVDLTNSELNVAFQVYYAQSASAEGVSNNDVTLSAMEPR